jgi:NTE family protein
MKKKLALVLGGGGARGALQVGAVNALISAGLTPDMLVGTSIGAVNAAYLAIRGFNQESLQGLVQAYHDASHTNLLPENYLWLGLRFLFNRPVSHPQTNLREFFIQHGVKPDLRFGDIKGVKLIIVSADLNSGCPVLFGDDPDECLLDALLASTALPPWIKPIARQSRWLVDGGVISNLPIEPAIRMGAEEIIALDLADFRDFPLEGTGFGPFLGKLFYTVETRQLQLETTLAQAQGVRVHRLHLLAESPIPLWDFQHSDLLIERGYQFTQQAIQEGMIPLRVTWIDRLAHQLRALSNRLR